MRSIWLFSILMFSSIQVNATTKFVEEVLFEKINERLSLMEDVAIYKFNSGINIEDLAREDVVVNKASESAARVGLNSDKTKKFFRAQINVAKAIQYRYFADWQSTPVIRKPRNLNRDIRPSLITLGNEINNDIVSYIKGGGAFSHDQFDIFDSSITINHVTENDKKLLFEALMKVY